MAWTAPMTWTASVLTAAQLNTHLRDNLLETAPAKATTSGRFFVTTGPNQIAERSIVGAKTTGGVQTTTSINPTWSDLITAGPSVTAVTGSSAIVIVTAQIENSTGGASGMMSYAVTGASAVSASSDRCLRLISAAGGQRNRASAAIFQTGLTPGSNVFTAKYTTHSGGTAGFDEREIFVIAL